MHFSLMGVTVKKMKTMRRLIMFFHLPFLFFHQSSRERGRFITLDDSFSGPIPVPREGHVLNGLCDQHLLAVSLFAFCCLDFRFSCILLGWVLFLSFFRSLVEVCLFLCFVCKDCLVCNFCLSLAFLLFSVCYWYSPGADRVYILKNSPFFLSLFLASHC